MYCLLDVFQVDEDDGLPTCYPVTVPSESPVLSGLSVSDLGVLDGRNPRLPVLYQYAGDHPSHRVKFKESRTFVYLIDPTPEGKAMALKLWMSIKIPGGFASGIRFKPSVSCLYLRYRIWYRYTRTSGPSTRRRLTGPAYRQERRPSVRLSAGYARRSVRRLFSISLAYVRLMFA